MLELDGVAKTYGTFEFGPLDLTVEDEVLAVLGPSGCGKSTLLSVVAGIVAPDAGTVRLNGRSLDGKPPEERGTVLVFQDGALFPHMTVRENIAYAGGTPDRIADLAAMLEIEAVLDQSAATLSGGEAQRVALARSLAADPDVLLLDEPLANLDTPIKRRLRFELRDVLADLDVPVVYVTHDQHHATVIGDRIAVMQNGRLHQVDAPEEIFRRPATRFVASFTGSTNLFPASVVERNGQGTVLEWGDRRIEASGADVDGDDVWFCIRPEYVMVVREDEPLADRENVLAGTVERRVFQGDDYRVYFRPDDPPETVEIRLPAPVYERLELANRDRVRVSLKQRAIHVIERPA